LSSGQSRAGGDAASGSLQIYFAGAIRGGRADAGLYADLIGYLCRFGRVLTAHVGDETLLREEQGLTEAEIFQRDMEWLRAADVVLAEVSTPSLGVGFEIGQALALGKKVICLHRLDAKHPLSAMIAGNPALTLHPYADGEAAMCLLGQILGATTD
jgi:hypothetical protein